MALFVDLTGTAAELSIRVSDGPDGTCIKLPALLDNREPSGKAPVCTSARLFPPIDASTARLRERNDNREPHIQSMLCSRSAGLHSQSAGYNADYE